MTGLFTRTVGANNVLRRRALLQFSAAAFAAGSLLAAPGNARAAGDPTAPVQQLNAALLAAMKAGRQTSFTQRYAMLTPAVEQAIDMTAILQASVGLRWLSLTPEQQSALLVTFRQYTITTYTANFDSYSGQSFRVLSDQRHLSNGEVVLRTEFVRTDGSTTPIDYVMRQTPAGWKAVDVLADGAISRVAVQRSDFRALLDRGGVAALQAGLMQKVASLSSGSAA